MRHYLILIFITFYIVACGTTGPLSIPEGVKDRKNFNYPPEIDTTCFPSISKCTE